MSDKEEVVATEDRITQLTKIRNDSGSNFGNEYIDEVLVTAFYLYKARKAVRLTITDKVNTEKCTLFIIDRQLYIWDEAQDLVWECPKTYPQEYKILNFENRIDTMKIYEGNKICQPTTEDYLNK